MTMHNLKMILIAAALTVASLALSGCITSTAVQTGRLPTAAEAQAQLQADILALKVAGCLTAEISGAASPIIAATVDANGQRIATMIDQTSGKVCGVPVATVTVAP